MAYKDSSGRITIDEQAAAQDIRRLQEAMQILSDSRKAIVNIINQASGEQGLAARAICEKAREMCGLIDALNNRLSETASFISRTVAHYQEVDRQVKEAIQASTAGWSSGGGGGHAIVAPPPGPKTDPSDIPGLAALKSSETLVDKAKDFIGDVADIFKSFGR